ncbi:hypothetical protein [Marinicella sp. W31]|uniref:hypothetical protein n=1 Tax=Marinicella sp. W31 TaxID=3023713 RepID=UPI003757FF18
MFKNIILITLLWTFTSPALADSCADEGEGNTDWVNIGTGQGPNDNSGCGDMDAGFQHIWVEITPAEVCGIFESCGYVPNYAFFNISEPHYEAVFSLDFDGLLNNLPVAKTVQFADYHVLMPSGDYAKLMDLEVQKVPGTRNGHSWRVDINWHQLGFVFGHEPTTVNVPADYSGELRFWVTLATRTSKQGSYAELSIEVVGENIYSEFIHPTRFDAAVEPSSIGLGLISADQVPPVGDVIHIINTINMY